MTSTLRHIAIVLMVAVVVLFTNLGGSRLWDRDEPRNAGCAVEMLSRGDWVTPVFDDELRTHKPILLYWFMMAAYAIFGVNEFAARFWSALLGVGSACLTYALGRRLFSPRVGLWGAVILVTTLMFDVAARAATPDSLLIFWSTAALCIYVYGTFAAPDSHSPSPGSIRLFPRWPVAVFMYAMMGLAVLAKGPVGLVLPTAVIGMYLLIRRLPSREAARSGVWHRTLETGLRMVRPFAPRHFLTTCWIMRPITAVLVVSAVALPWYVAVGLRTDGEWVRGFLLEHNLGRAAEPMEGHGGSFLFYPLALLVGFFPWSVFAAPTLLESVRRIHRRTEHPDGFILAACWVGVYVGLFSLAKTKLPSYITPCYPAVALLVANYVVAWVRGTALSASFWPHAALGCLGVVGLGMAVAVPYAAVQYVPGEEWLGLIGCIPILTAIAAFGFLRAKTPRRAVVMFSGGAVLFTTMLFAFAAERVDQHRSFDRVLTAVFQRSDNPKIGTLGVLEPSWVFYANRPLDHLFAPELTADADHETVRLGPPRTADWQFKPRLNVWHYLQAGADRFAITTVSQLEQMEPLPAHVEVIARAPRFLRDDDLVLLGSRPRIADRPTEPSQY
ncbi:MAG: ArnT family glycosyltransferase [Planctomycetota bacterium]